MRIHPKSPAVLEAQTVDYFLSDNVPGTIRAVRVGEQITHLLTLMPEEVCTDEAARAMNPLAKRDDLVAFSDAYVTHLRSVEVDREELATRASLIAAYEYFRPTVERQELTSENKIGAGEFSTAHAVTVDGKPYVARKVYTPHDLTELEKHFEASRLVQDITGIEHIEAISFKDGITIAPRLPGSSIQCLSSETISRITPAQLQTLYQTLTEANARGVYFDTAAGNLLYDPETGFSVLDISTKHNGMYRSAPEAFAWYFMAAAGVWKPNDQQSSVYGSRLYEILQTISTILGNNSLSTDTTTLLEDAKSIVFDTTQRCTAFEQPVTKHKSKVS
ncbi:MAG: hypothetical protein WBP12_04770 [Candidatus Saccharimonas sp.]